LFVLAIALISHAVARLFGADIDITNVLAATFVVFVAFTLLQAIDLPILFKFGQKWGFFATMIPVFLFCVNVLISNVIGVEHRFHNFELAPELFDGILSIGNIVAGVAGLGAVMFVSYLLYVRFYKQREF